MALNGIASFLHAPLDEAKKSYGKVLKLSAAISYKETLDKNASAVYADNVKQWEDNSVTGGKITLGVLDDDPTIFAPLLGRKTKKVSAGDGEKEVYVGNSEDISQPVGFGFIEYGRNKKMPFYQVNFYPKVTFAPYDKEGETKKNNSDYKTPSIEGTIYNLDNGDYKYENRFDTLAEAVEVLYALFGKTEIPTDTLENLNQDYPDMNTDTDNDMEEQDAFDE